MFGCTERVLSHVLRVVLLGMSFAGDVNCLAQVTVGSADCSYSFAHVTPVVPTVV